MSRGSQTRACVPNPIGPSRDGSSPPHAGTPAREVASARRALLAAASAVAFWTGGCGESSEARLARETLADAAPVADAFVTDLEAGRIDGALSRTTRAFQGAALSNDVRTVQESLRQALGAARTRTPRAAEAVVAEGETGRAREAVIVFDGAWERGAAVLRCRVQRDAARGGWLVDGCEVRNDLFTWTFRR